MSVDVSLPVAESPRWAGWTPGSLDPAEALPFVGVVVLAAVLRLGWPGLTEFKLDEAHLATLALAMAEGGDIPVRGISSSIGVANFPMSAWLYALPFLLWRHVYAATLFTGALNTLAVAGGYWLVRRYWGPRAALAAALMFAVAPWAVHHSRKIWAQNLLPFFVVGWAISGALAFVEGRARFVVAHLLCLGIALQTHLAGAGLVPATLLALVLFRRRVRWRWVGAGAGLVLLTAVPYLTYIASRTDALTGALSGSGAPTSGAPWRFAWLLATGREIHALAGPEAFPAYLATVPDVTAVHLLWGALIAGGLILLAGRALPARPPRGPAQDAGLLILLWAMAPIVVFSLPYLPVELHYLLPIYPAPFIAAGVFFDAVVAAISRPVRVAAWAILLISIVAQVVVWGQLLRFTATTATPGGVGVPLAHRLSVVKLAKEMMHDSVAVEVLLAGPGAATATDEFAAVFDFLLHDVPHRFVDGRDTAVFPATVAVVVLDEAAGIGAAIYDAAAVRDVAMAQREGEGLWRVLALPAAAAPPPEVTFDPPHILTNRAAFQGYDLPVVHAEGTATWRVYWYAGETSNDDFHLFNHLLDQSGQRISQKDGPAFAAGQWHAQDVVVSTFVLDWPANAERPLTMRIGMYSYPDVAPVLVFDVAGNPASDAVTIPLP